jgi:hypothetical protein
LKFHNAKALLKEKEKQHTERSGVQRSVVEVSGLCKTRCFILQQVQEVQLA